MEVSKEMKAESIIKTFRLDWKSGGVKTLPTKIVITHDDRGMTFVNGRPVGVIPPVHCREVVEATLNATNNGYVVGMFS